MKRVSRVLTVLLLALLAHCGFRQDPGDRLPELAPTFQSPDVRLNTSTPAGDFDVGRPATCADGNRVYVAWYDDREGLGDIRMNRSTNGGTSWFSNDVRVNTDVEGSAERGDPIICCSGLNVYVAWLDKRDGFWDVRFNRSLDGGETWLFNDLRVNTNARGTGNQRDPSICCVGDVVFMVWATIEDGGVRFNRSGNAGAGFRPLETLIGERVGASRNTDICCDTNDNITVAWQNDRDGLTDIYSNASNDSGGSWLGEIRVDTNATAGAQASSEPSLFCLTDQAYMIWRAQEGGGERLYFSKNVTQGISWRNPIRIDSADSPPSQIESYDIGAITGFVHVVWTDNRTGELDPFYTRSLNSGNDWPDVSVRLVGGAKGATASTNISLCVPSRPNVGVCWSEGTGSGGSNVLFSYTSDDGASWAPDPLQVSSSSSGALVPSMSCVTLRANIAWRDLRNGSGGDIFQSRTLN